MNRREKRQRGKETRRRRKRHGFTFSVSPAAERSWAESLREAFDEIREALIAEGYQPCSGCSVLTLSQPCEMCRMQEAAFLLGRESRMLYPPGGHTDPRYR